MTDDIEHALRDLSTRLHVPPAERDMTAAVLDQLDHERPHRIRPARRVLAAAVAALVALATAMAVSPAVRAAVYDLLRIGGVDIHENQPAPATPPAEPALPGEQDLSLDDARAAAPFPLKLPARLGPPRTVRIADGTPPHIVSMTFPGDLRVDQFDGGLHPLFTKFTAAADVHHVRVHGSPAIWVDRPHTVIYTDRDGHLRESSARLAGSTLIWEAGGITYRVEGDLTQAQAIEIAESLR